jgi:cadmium resistance protein CadD (predicted permease)
MAELESLVLFLATAIAGALALFFLFTARKKMAKKLKQGMTLLIIAVLFLTVEAVLLAVPAAAMPALVSPLLQFAGLTFIALGAKNLLKAFS